MIHNYVIQLMLNPYACPLPVQIPKEERPAKDIYHTLFTSDQEKEEARANLFNDLSKNLDNIYQLQTTYFQPKEPKNIHGDSLPRFLHFLCDPTVSLLSLSPVPLMDNIDFSDLAKQMVQLHVDPERASFAIHHYVYQFKISSDRTTQLFTKDLDVQKGSKGYFATLLYSLYIKGLFNCTEILEFIITHFKPKHAFIFKNEIFHSFNILLNALYSPMMKSYFKMMKMDFLREQSQLIQLAASMSFYSDEVRNKLQPIVFQNLDEYTKYRAKLIFRIIKQDYISFSASIYRLLSSSFPYYDIPSILKEYAVLIQFNSPKEKKKNLLELLSVAMDFPNEYESVAALVVEFIKMLDIEFPLKDFVGFLYKNIKNIKDFTYLFYELQINKQFKYLDFLKSLTSSGYSTVLKEETMSILMFLPPKKYTTQIRGTARQLYMKYDNPAIFEEEKKFSQYIQSIENNYANANKLLPYFHYQIGYLICTNKTINFFKKTQMLAELGLQFMIIPDFINATGTQKEKINPSKNENIVSKRTSKTILENRASLNKSAQEKKDNDIINTAKIEFSYISLIQIKHIIPLLYSRGCLDQFLALFLSPADDEPETSNQNNEFLTQKLSKYFQLSLFFDRNYKDSTYITNYKNSLEKQICFIEAQSNVIFSSKIKQFITDHSFLCNVQTLNVFYSVKNFADLERSMQRLLYDLLLFNNLNINYLWEFFVSFTDSFCVFFPVELFVTRFISVILFDVSLSSLMESTIYQFFYRLIQKNIIMGYQYLDIIHELISSMRIDVNECENANFLFGVLRNIVHESPQFFNLTNLLTDSVGNWLSSKHHILRDIIQPLSERPIILSHDAQNNLLGRPSNYGALVFMLLPKKLSSRDMKDVFSYYVSNISFRTTLLWTTWLKCRPFYNLENIVEKTMHGDTESKDIIVPNNVFGDYPEDYRNQITVSFLKLIMIKDVEPTKISVYLEAWRLFCDTQKIAMLSFQRIIQDIKSDLFSYNKACLHCLRQITPHLTDSESDFEKICDMLFQHVNDNPSKIKVIASIILVYFSKYAKTSKSDCLIRTVNNLLELIKNMYSKEILNFNFVVDCFNYFSFITALRDKEFQETVFKHIKDTVSNLKKKLNRYLLFNFPHQMLKKCSDPLYIEPLEPQPTDQIPMMPPPSSIPEILFDEDIWL